MHVEDVRWHFLGVRYIRHMTQHEQQNCDWLAPCALKEAFVSFHPPWLVAGEVLLRRTG